MQEIAHTQTAAGPEPLSQHNPGTTRLGMAEDERRRAAIVFLQAYYRDVELGRAPLD
ncbi:MAG TPA: hypothetical protein VLI41_08335 [Phenylobacterium sp.]|uniref:hypothetical protein n=1 Tax=Phenylobacterium sp. TaxID=1871053 RepID=UPI002C46832C|nr:hypothetical protein [Phenylobacterium sp.]HSV03200.1 hypothetical protein [Phenylobacterium sp.]